MEVSGAPLSLHQVVSAFVLIQPIYVATKLQIADHLYEGKKPVDELATLVGANANYLYRLLSALASTGIFQEEADEVFSLNASADLLRKDSNDSLWPTIIRAGEEHYAASGGLLKGVQEGTTPFNNVFGKSFFQYTAAHAEFGDAFDAGMAEINSRNIVAVMRKFDFEKVQSIADIGGGDGHVIARILNQYSHLSAILFDLPHVVEKARENLRHFGLNNRCRFVAGNFFEEIPGGADVYLFSHVLHDWQDAEVEKILMHTVRAMTEGSKVIVLETIIGHSLDLRSGKLLDLGMLIMTGGVERTLSQFERLFKNSGLKVAGVAAISEQASMMEFVKDDSEHQEAMLSAELSSVN